MQPCREQLMITALCCDFSASIQQMENYSHFKAKHREQHTELAACLIASLPRKPSPCITTAGSDPPLWRPSQVPQHPKTPSTAGQSPARIPPPPSSAALITKQPRSPISLEVCFK